MTREEINNLQEYIHNLIKNRKKIKQKPTGDDLFAVLGHLELLKDLQQPFPSNVDEAAKEYLLSVDAYRNTDYGCKFEQFDIETFKAGAVWRQSNLWKSADGEDLPELEREVVVFTQSFPNDVGIMKVGIAHRPNPNGWDGRNILTGEVNHYTPKTYDKGGWSIPDVKIWLDCDLPLKEDEV